MALVKKEIPVAQSSEVATRSGPARLPLVSLGLGAITLVGLAISIWMDFFYAPTDAVEDQPQRIFYVHVPADPDHRLNLGTHHLGHVVDLGCTSDHNADPLVRLHWLSDAAQLHGPHARQRARGGGHGDHLRDRCADHL